LAGDGEGWGDERHAIEKPESEDRRLAIGLDRTPELNDIRRMAKQARKASRTSVARSAKTGQFLGRTAGPQGRRNINFEQPSTIRILLL